MFKPRFWIALAAGGVILMALAAGSLSTSSAQGTPTPVETEIVPLPDETLSVPSAVPAPSPTPTAPPILTPGPEPTGDAPPDTDLAAVEVRVQAVSIPPTGLEPRTADRPWRACGGVTSGVGVPLEWGMTIEGTDTARITFGDKFVLMIGGPAWSVEFGESGLVLTSDRVLYVTLFDSLDWPLVVRVVLPKADFTLTGAQGSVSFDGSAAVIDLIGGQLDVAAPVQQTFDRATDATNVMRVRLAGRESAAEVIQPDPAAAPVVPEDLQVTITMAEPVPDTVSWLVQLDLDGDPATGLQDGDLPGADLVIDVRADESGQRVGEAYLITTGLFESEWVNIRAGRVPVTLMPGGDAAFTAGIALADLRQALDTAIDPVTGAALSLPFSFERLRWHAAVIQDAVVVDQYPPRGTVYVPAPVVPPAAPGSLPAERPTCAAETTNPANLRARPDLNAAIVGGTTAGDAVTVIGQSLDGEWYGVALANGRRAWVAAFLVGDLTCPAGFVLPVGE
jgi:hypothetical protein